MYNCTCNSVLGHRCIYDKGDVRHSDSVLLFPILFAKSCLSKSL